MTLVTTITRFKAKIGFEDQLIDALRKFDNSNSISWQILSLGDSEYAALNTYDSIEGRSRDVVSGLDWLDSITPILELYEDCLLYTSPSPRDRQKSRMPSSA